MSHIKRFAENVSVVLGGDGEITEEVQEIGQELLDLAKKAGLQIEFEERNHRIILQGGRNFKVEELVKLMDKAILDNDEYFVGEDKVDLEYVRTCIADGHGRDAFHYANKLDTAVRDMIPQKVWIYLCSFG